MLPVGNVSVLRDELALTCPWPWPRSSYLALSPGPAPVSCLPVLVVGDEVFPSHPCAPLKTPAAASHLLDGQPNALLTV